MSSFDLVSVVPVVLKVLMPLLVEDSEEALDRILLRVPVRKSVVKNEHPTVTMFFFRLIPTNPVSVAVPI